MGGMPYCTREMILRAPDLTWSARLVGQVDRLIESASRDADRVCRRPPGAFLPITATRTFDWPASSGSAYRLWFDGYSLASASAVSSGGTTISADDYFLRPDAGPAYEYLEIDLASSSALSAGDTHQRAVSITGVWMATATDDRSAGTLDGGINASTSTLVLNGEAAATIGVGSVLLIDSERMIVTDRAFTDSGINIAADLAENEATRSVSVPDGTAFSAGESIMVGAERMDVEAIVGNTLIVSRATQGSVLAAHTSGADVYVSRTLTVQRGALGTTAAAHSDAAAVSRHQVAPLAETYTVARTMLSLMREVGAYSDEGGSPQRSIRPSLDESRTSLFSAHGRKARMRTV